MSASPGLPTLPAEPAGGGDQFAAPQPAPVTDPSVFAAPGASKPASSGLGLADYKAARSNDDMEYLKNLPTQQKIGLMLEAFGSGVNGRPNPVDALLENKRKRESEFRNELGTTIKMIDEGLNIVKKVSDPKARAALIEQMTRAAGPNGDVVKGALLAAGTAGEDEIRNIVSVLQNPRVQVAVVKASGGDAEKARKLMSDSDFMKRLEQTADQDTLPSVVAKMNLITRAMEKMPQFKSATGAAFTMKDLREQNAALPKEFQLTDAEFGAINRNQSFLIPYGLKTDKTAQVDQEAAARKAEGGTWSEPYQMNGATVQKNSVTGEVRTAVSRPPQVNVTSGAGVVPSQHADLHGQDYLSTLPSGTAGTVKGIAEGRIDAKSLSTRGGEREAMLQRVTQYDPTFNQANYATRQAVQKDFTSGVAARNVTAINTAIGHIGSMADLADGLQNHDWPLVNKMVNAISTQTGRPEVKQFDTAKSAVASELMRVFRQVGASERETQDWEKKFDSAGSPAQLSGVIKTGAELLQSRVDALDDQWKRGMNTPDGYPKLLSDKSKAVMEKVSKGGGASKGPQPGAVQGGYRFKGGDPSKQENWEKV